MMMMTSRAKWKFRRVAVVAAVCFATGLAACGGSGGGGGGGGGGSQNAGSATKGDLTWWSWTPGPNVADQYIAEFNKEFPDIKITYKQLTIDAYTSALRPALASNTGPDLYGINPGTRMELFSGFAVDVRPAMEKTLGSDWESKVAPIGIPGLTDPDGKLVAASVGSTFSGSVWINPKLFDKYKLSPPKTMDEWEKVCAVFKQNDVTCFVQGAAQTAFNRDTMQAIANSIQPGYWTKASTGDAKWTDPVMVETLTTWKSMFTNGIMQDGALGVQQYPDANNAFVSQKAAMVMMGTWYMQYTTVDGMKAAISAAGVAKPEPFPIVPIPFPGGDGKYHLSGDSDYGLAVNSKSKAQDAATTFSVWLGTSKAGQQKVADVLNDLPALNGVTPHWDAIKLTDEKVSRAPLEQLIKEAAPVTEPRLGLIGVDLGVAIGVASTTVAEGKATPEEAAQTLQKAAEDAGIEFK